MEEKTKRPITITKKVYISPTREDVPLEPNATKFGNSPYLTEVINRSKFGVNWFSSFGSEEMQKLTFAIGTTTGPYHCSATALARHQRRSERRPKPLCPHLNTLAKLTVFKINL